MRTKNGPRYRVRSIVTTTPGTTGLTFEALFEAAPDALLAVGRDGVCRLANRRGIME